MAVRTKVSKSANCLKAYADEARKAAEIVEVLRTIRIGINRQCIFNALVAMKSKRKKPGARQAGSSSAIKRKKRPLLDITSWSAAMDLGPRH